MVRASGATSSAAPPPLGRTFRRGRGTCDGARPENGKKKMKNVLECLGCAAGRAAALRLECNTAGKLELRQEEEEEEIRM